MGLAEDLIGTAVNQARSQLKANQEFENRKKQRLDSFRAMRDRLNTDTGPQALSTQPLGMEKSGYKAKTFDQPLAEFDYARKKANEAIGVQSAEAQDAMARHFARLGTMNSGPAIKQAQIAEDAAAKQRADAMESIGAQEAQAKRALAQDEANKEFQSEESMRGRNASREQFNAQSDFAMQQFNADQTFKDKVFRFDANSKLAALDMDLEKLDMAHEELAINKRTAERELNKRKGIVNEILSPFLGD